MARGSLRLFVALYPPREAAEAMIGALPAIAESLRLTPPEQVHMTLQFIGDTAERELKEVTESVRRSAAGIPDFELKPMRLISLPEKGAPRLIAMETDAPGPLLEIQRRLVNRLARKAGSGGAFVPHFTLLRYANDGKPLRVEAPVDLPAFAVRSVVLVRSILRPGGAVHAPVEEVALETV